MKKIILAFLIILMSASPIFAQTTTVNKFLVMSESRVKSGSVFAANQLKINPLLVKSSNGIISSRNAFRSESGRTYIWTITEQIGQWLDLSSNLWKNAIKSFPGMMEADSVNSNGATSRSIWIRMNEMSQTPKDFEPAKFAFRRVTIFTVPFDKIDAYEEAQTKRSALAIKMGITTPFFVYKARFGYSSNTYLTIEPDVSDIAYYSNRKERQEKKTTNNAEWQALNQITSPISTNVRIDQLYIVK
jgi:hypothetical protein